MAVTIKKLKEWLQQREDEIDRLQEEAKHLRWLIAFMEEQEGEDAESAVTPGQLLEDEIEKVLEDASKPIHYKEVYERLRRRGAFVRGEDPERNVGAHMSRARDRFVSHGKGIWGLKKWGTTKQSDEVTNDDVEEEDNEQQLEESPQLSILRPPRSHLSVRCLNCKEIFFGVDTNEDPHHLIVQCPNCGAKARYPKGAMVSVS